MLQIEGEIDGELLGPGPRIVGASAERHVVVAVVGTQLHQQNVASEIAMGYGYTPNEEAAGTAADAWEEE